MSDFYDRLDREEKDLPPPPAGRRRLGLRRPGGTAQALPAAVRTCIWCRRMGRWNDRTGVPGPLLRPRGGLPGVSGPLSARAVRVPRVDRLAAAISPGTAGPATGRPRSRSPSTSRSVFATDASADQVKNAEPHPRVEYAVAPAEQCPLPDHCRRSRHGGAGTALVRLRPVLCRGAARLPARRVTRGLDLRLPLGERRRSMRCSIASRPSSSARTGRRTGCGSTRATGRSRSRSPSCRHRGSR